VHTSLSMRDRKQRWLTVGLCSVTVLLFLLSLSSGPVYLSPGKILALVLQGHDEPLRIVLFEIRLPRALLAALVGATLGLSGAALQGLLLNPLAEPGVIGISGCAALGAVIVFYSGLGAFGIWLLPLGGMTGAFLAVVLLYGLAGRRGRTQTLILAGIAINSIAAALTSLALNLAESPFAAYDIFFWLMGSLADRSIEHVLLVLPFTLLGWVLLLSTSASLDALSLGEDTARSLGVSLLRVRRRMIIGTALAVGSAVSVCGMIGFVGLLVPHILRPLCGHRPGALLPASALGGAGLTLAADLATRVPLGAGELKLGVVTALVGAPFFIHLVLQQRNAS
jgi:iron complex transport system permease protein